MSKNNHRRWQIFRPKTNSLNKLIGQTNGLIDAGAAYDPAPALDGRKERILNHKILMDRLIIICLVFFFLTGLWMALNENNSSGTKGAGAAIAGAIVGGVVNKFKDNKLEAD